MPAWICPTCGGHYPDSAAPPQSCPICVDERQFVPPSGQRWVTMNDLAGQGYVTEISEVEPGLLGVGTRPGIGVGHRGLLVRTPAGNVLWDAPAYLDEQAIEAVRRAGGVHTVTSSHPHMYGASVDWADRFDAKILLPEADLAWLRRPSPRVRTWSGTAEPLPGVTLIQCGGHFPGSAALHWAGGVDGAGALLVGDTLFVTPGEDRVSFGWSFPNHLPLPESGVRGIVRALRPYRFERIYGGWWQPVLREDAEQVVRRDAERYIQFLRDEVSLG